jgi:hypothetical protein
MSCVTSWLSSVIVTTCTFTCVHKHLAPDERTDAAQDDSQLVDAQWCGGGSHALRVAQSIVPLKGSPSVFSALIHI